jgi:hypothetical protein
MSRRAFSIRARRSLVIGFACVAHRRQRGERRRQLRVALRPRAGARLATSAAADDQRNVRRLNIMISRRI